MYCTPKDGTINQKNGTEKGDPPGRRRSSGVSGPPCPNCGRAIPVLADGEVCCAGCGAVLEPEQDRENEAPVSKMNLYQAIGVGTAKVNLGCARLMHEPGRDMSMVSSACTKLDLPMHAAQEAYSTYLKILHEKRRGRYPRDGSKGSAGCPGGQETNGPARARAFTKAHIATFAIHRACCKYGIPRPNNVILEAVMSNFGTKKKFTILKAYSEVGPTARSIGITCEFGKSVYYLRLYLARLQESIGPGPLYDVISLLAYGNLEELGGSDGCRARAALDIAKRSAGLHVQV